MPVVTFESSGDFLADRRFHYAEGALADGDPEAAADLAAQTLERVPDFTPAWVLLGRAEARRGRLEPARQAFRRALALDSQDRLGVGVDLARLGDTALPGAMSESFVRGLFDAYADRFDTHLQGTLAYRGPDVMMAALDSVAPGRRYEQALDLGCGTGLMGAALRTRVDRLAGCDLSPAMVRQARSRGVYERLVVEDLRRFLSAEPDASADLVTAADVFIYVGDLEPVLRESARVLKSGGLVAFTVQSTADETVDLVLGEDARFHHGRNYLDRVAGTAGLRPVHAREASIRRDRGLDVPGFMIVLER